MKEYKNILTEIKGRVGIVTLNRPKSYNALNYQLLSELMDSLTSFDKDKSIGAMVITGNEKTFAAGADIIDMVDASPDDMKKSPFIPAFDLIRRIKKPIIAAVSGYCLGGGCELAMSCDLIISSESAVFGQPEINLGIIPGAGGTQRLTRAVGKVIAMEMILNNRTLSAEEAYSFNLINKIYPVEDYLKHTISLAQEIAERAPLAVQAAKEIINQSFDVSLTEGLQNERESFFNLFSSQDQKEGMNAFLDKRDPSWKGD
ncbi:MAG: enoyl-CoA hydratase/isomerase family protein [Anaerolineales bacterium]|nr:enoyl-CoA hydratase/isomerase family protein [Anaerolineales bacterium]